VLFNVYHPSSHVSNSLSTPNTLEHIISNNEIRLKKWAQWADRKYQLKVKYVSKTVDTVGELENYVSEHHPDLVVMGMDSNLVEYKLFGNTTTAAIRRLKFPVLVVPLDVSFKGIKKILYAHEPAYLSQDNHLDLLKEFVKKFEAKLQILHVQSKTDNQISTGVNNQISAIDAIMENVDHTYSLVVSSSVREGIIQGVKEWEADLLIMVPHKIGFWDLFLKGSTTRDMALRTRVPLLVLPNVD